MTTAESDVVVTLLGGVAVRRDGESVRVASTRAISLLAYLVACAPAAQPRQHLAGLFWPDTPEGQARTNLRRELHQLRQLVPDEALAVTDTTIGWVDAASCSVDVRDFLNRAAEVRDVLTASDAVDPGLAGRGRAAVETYTGPFLPGAYDDWALEIREGLLRRCVELCDDLVKRLGPEDPLAATELARRRIQLEPLEETGYRQLMMLQVAARDRAGALTTYHRCASVLEEQLGVAPTAATSALLTSIIELTDGPGADRVPRGMTAVGATAHERGLVGRDPDVAVVAGRWRAACEGRPGMLVLTGDPGVGKSRLLAELAQAVTDEGSAVAASRCFSASGVALAPVADWLRAETIASSLRSLDPVWKEEVERLVPPLTTASPASDADPRTAPSGRALVDSWQQHRFFDGLARALTNVDRPLLLTLDDLHWCDEETLAFIAFLLGTARQAPVLVLATARSDELHQRRELQSRVAQLASAGTLTEHRLEPLSLAATTELAGRLFQRAVDPADAALLQAASGGYPLYVVEAARESTPSPAEPQPDQVDQGEGDQAAVNEAGLGAVLRRRLAELSPAAQRCAALAAAVGRDFQLDLLLAASDEDEVTVVRAVDELWRRHVLHQVDRGYDFSHDLLRAEAYASVDPAQRWLEHRRLAAALQVIHAADLEPVAAGLADQLERGGRLDEAVPFYLQAGEAAARVFANAEALRLFRRGLDLVARTPPSAERDQRELDVRHAMSAPLNALRGYADPELQQTFERSVALSASLGRPDLELANLVGLWAATFVQGDIVGSHAIATRAIGLAEEVPTLSNQARFSRGGSAVSLGRPRDGVTDLELACELSEGSVTLNVGSRPEVHARAWSAHGWWLLGEAERAAREAARAVSDADAASHPYSLAIAHAYGAVTAQLRADLPRLDEHLEELTALCAKHNYAYYREWALVLGGWRLGSERGIARIKVGLANLSASSSRARMPYWLYLLAMSQREVGQDAAADATLDAAWAAGMQRGDRWWLPEVMRARAATKPPEVAVDILTKALTRAVEQSSPALADLCRADLALRGAEDLAFGAAGSGDER